jgi:CRP/FNR family transcriptional regulator
VDPVRPLSVRIDACEDCVARQISLCSQLDDEGIAAVRAISSTRQFAKGETIFDENRLLDHVFIITRGFVKLYRVLADGRRQVLGFLGPGDVLGGVKRQGDASCTAETLTDMECCAFQRESFLALLRKYPSLGHAFLFIATDEVEAQNDHMVLLGRRHAPERVAAFLVLLDFRCRLGRPKRVTAAVTPLPMSRGDIADHLGLTIETVSRTFADFRRRGLIDTPTQHNVVLRQPQALMELSGLLGEPRPRIRLGL